MKSKILSMTGCSFLMMAVLAGCGQANNPNNTSVSNQPSAKTANTSDAPTTSNTSSAKVIPGQNGTLIVGASKYAGQANLKKLESAAKKKPHDAQAQIDAGKSAHVNGDDAAAVRYYKKAIEIDAKSGLAYTNLGNIYLRDKKDAKKAATYYQKATKNDPSYGFGWYNLAIAQVQLGNKGKAEQTLAQGLKKVKSSDPAYPMMQSEQQKLQGKAK